MTGFTVALVLVVATAVILRWRRPAWYWLVFGAVLAALRVLVRYVSVMDACGLTVPPSRWRLALARIATGLCRSPAPRASCASTPPEPAWCYASSSAPDKMPSTSPPPRTGCATPSACTA